MGHMYSFTSPSSPSSSLPSSHPSSSSPPPPPLPPPPSLQPCGMRLPPASEVSVEVCNRDPDCPNTVIIDYYQVYTHCMCTYTATIFTYYCIWWDQYSIFSVSYPFPSSAVPGTYEKQPFPCSYLYVLNVKLNFYCKNFKARFFIHPLFSISPAWRNRRLTVSEPKNNLGMYSHTYMYTRLNFYCCCCVYVCSLNIADPPYKGCRNITGAEEEEGNGGRTVRS